MLLSFYIWPIKLFFMGLRSHRIFFYAFVIIALLCEQEGDARRGKRCRSPPPPKDCTVSEWSSWSLCSQICHTGVRSRSRSVVTVQTSGGKCPYHLSETGSCGSINGGCEQICDPFSGQCSCQAGYIASGNHCNDLNECTSLPCSHTCVNTIGSFRCECPVGFYLTSDWRTCARLGCGSPVEKYCDSSGICPDINTRPACENGGTCRDTIDGYSCQCILGYTGRHCETNIDDCQEVECLNGGSCQDGVASFTCVCTDGFSGHRCERQQSLCTECTTDTLCVMFIDAPIRCLQRQYQIPVLVNETNISQKVTVELEKGIAATLDTKVNDSESTRTRRALAKFFYVEIFWNMTISSSRSLIIFTALDARNKSFPLLASQACAMLSSSGYNCMENCDILRLAELPCSKVGRNSGEPSEEKLGGLSTVDEAEIAVFMVLMSIAIFYYRKKNKKAKHNQHVVANHTDSDRAIYLNNQLPAGTNDIEINSGKRNLNEKLILRNLDPTPAKINNIKASENIIYNTASNSDAKAVNLPRDDDKTVSKK